MDLWFGKNEHLRIKSDRLFFFRIIFQVFTVIIYSLVTIEAYSHISITEVYYFYLFLTIRTCN